MASKGFLSFFLIMFFSYLEVGFCDNSSPLDQLLPGLGQSPVIKNAQCMQKLLPCQPYLKNPNNPPQSCCGALQEVHDHETDCLCNFINNSQLLQSVNVPKEEVMKLPEACGLKVESSLCNTGTTEAGSTPSEGEQTGPGKDNTSESENSASSTKMVTSYGIISLLTAIVFSAY